MILKGYILTYGYILLILVITSILHKKISGILTRKIIHVGISFCFIIFYKYFGCTFNIMVPPFTFIILNYISYKKGLLKSMEENKSPGTVYYAVSVFIMCLITYFNNDFYPYFGIGLFVMAFGDGFAPIVSHYIKSMKIYKDKTLVGSLTVFIISIIVVLIFNKIFSLNYEYFKIILIGIISLLLELIGRKGIDNLLLPLGVSIISYLLGVI